MIPSTNSPISSRIVEARRSRYSSGSINPALKNMSKEALLKTPLSQLSSSSDSTTCSSTSSTSFPSSSSSSYSTPLEPQSVSLSSLSSSSSSPSPSQLQSSPSFSSLSLGTSSRKPSGLSTLNLGLTLGMGSGSSSGSPRVISPRVHTSNSNSNLNPNVSSSPSSSSTSILEEIPFPYREGDRQEVYKAILSGDVELLNQVLVSLGVRSITTIPLPTSIKNHRERNWLHVAVSEGQHASIISFLLKPQEDGTPSALGINDKTGYGSTPLHEAVEAGNFTTVVALLDLGAKVSLPTPEGILPLHAFVKNKLLL
jgi:hypothetical protein